jgi:hypothetical protein
MLPKASGRKPFSKGISTCFLAGQEKCTQEIGSFSNHSGGAWQLLSHFQDGRQWSGGMGTASGAPSHP